jgi:putative spermidine/putrescine transport system permease protein
MTSAPVAADSAAPSPTPPPSLGRRLGAWMHGRPTTRLGSLLIGPLGWLIIVYVGSLAILFLNAFFSRDAFSGATIYVPTLDNFAGLVRDPYPGIAIRTVAMATAVTITCAVLATPIAFYMAKVASPRIRNALVVAVIVPLWASYLIKVYAWRLILAERGILNWALEPIGLQGPGSGDVAVWLVLTYLWLPYMILPLYAGFERIPSSLLEASSDLGGRSVITFRRVILPLVFPALVAGSIFTFSLTLGDYIAPAAVSTTFFIGNAIYQTFGAGNFPLAAALSLVPLVIVIAYLLIARRLGAFEAL